MSRAEVDAWLRATDNPKADVIAAVRAVVTSDARITEAVKYRAPAFLHRGILAYFHWNAREFASLIFPSGASIPGDFPHLQGTGRQRMIRFATVAAVKVARAELLAIVEVWCTSRWSRRSGPRAILWGARGRCGTTAHGLRSR